MESRFKTEEDIPIVQDELCGARRVNYLFYHTIIFGIIYAALGNRPLYSLILLLFICKLSLF